MIERFRGRQTGDDLPREHATAGSIRRLRADARRNRAHILEVAFATFAAEGTSVPVHEIARKAGVGTGTVSRHFPTKEALFAAVVQHRVEQLAQRAHELAAHADPATAFLEYFALLVKEGAANRAIADGLRGIGFDIEGAAAAGAHDFGGVLRDLLTRAQQAGTIRADVEPEDVKAFVVGCVARQRDITDDTGTNRMIAIVSDGLRNSAR